MDWRKIAAGTTALALITIPLVFSRLICIPYELPKIICLYILGALLILFYNLGNAATPQTGTLARFLWLYLIWLALKSFFSIMPIISTIGVYNRYQGFLFFLFSIFFFFIGTWLAAFKRHLLKPLIITGTIVALISIIEYWQGMIRTTSTIGNALFLAIYLMMVIPCLLGYIYQTRKFWIKATGLGCLFLLTTGLIFTFSRSGWGGLGLAYLLMLIFIGWRRLFIKERRTTILVLLVTISSLSCAFFMVQRQNQLLLAVHQANSRLPIMAQAVDQNRIVAAQTAWRIFLEHPLGTGISTLAFTSTQFIPVSHIINFPNQTLDMAHNDFLHTLATQGVVGGLFYLIFLVIVFRLWWRWWRDSERDYLTAGLWTALWVHLILLQFCFTGTSYTFVFWLILGFVSAAVDIKHNRLLKINNRLKVGVALCLVVLVMGYAITTWLAETNYNRARQEFAKTKDVTQYAKRVDYSSDLVPWDSFYRYQKAKGIFMRITRTELSNQERYQLNLNLMRQIDLMLRYNSLDYRYYLLAADAFYAYGYYEKAAYYYAEVIRLYPNNFQFYYRFSVVYRDNNEPEKAIAYLQKALELKPDFEPARRALKLLTGRSSN